MAEKVKTFMGHPLRTVLADTQGLWEETAPGEKRLLIAWAETLAVHGAKFEAGDYVFTGAVLDTDYGDFTEIFTDQPGFEDVAGLEEAARMASECLPGLPADWLQRIIDLPQAGGAEIWRRD